MITNIYYNVSGNKEQIIEVFRRIVKKQCDMLGTSYRDPCWLLKEAIIDNEVFAVRFSYPPSLDWGYVSRQEYYKEDYVASKEDDEVITETEYKELFFSKPKCIRVPQRTQGITEVSTVF